jgi:hypothetical protein
VDACLEIDKNYNISQNYSCEYNGIGSTPMSIPHRVGDTALDQGGDLLIDRYELGCRFTRGDPIAIPESGASYYDRGGARRNGNDNNYWPLFRGYRSIETTEDSSTPFKGCGGVHSRTKGPEGIADEYPSGFTPEYYRILQGDCIGNHSDTLYTNPCTTAQLEDGHVNRYTVSTPGLNFNETEGDCSEDTASQPTTLSTKVKGHYAPNFVMQSEFLAVFHNTFTPGHNGGDYSLPFEGPTTSALSDSAELNALTGMFGSHCSINLAAIDGSGYMKPRWLSVGQMHSSRTNFKGTTGTLYSKTVNEITEVNASTTPPLTFYNGNEGDGSTASFKLPSASLRNSPRYRGTTRLSRIFSSNSSKLPPLGKLSSEQAQYLCSDYFVQVGFASNNGNFAPEQAIKPKRPLRRPESVTSAAWNETYDDATISTIENSSSTGSCNAANKNNSGIGFSKGNLIDNRLAHNALARVPMMTGSSTYSGLSNNTTPHHTERCVSKFGIQDIIGNVSEHNSERIFCDYSMDAIWIGPVTGTWGTGQDAINQGAGGPDINYFNTNPQRLSGAVLKSGQPTDESNDVFELRFREGESTITDVKPWVQIGVDSGYCSVVDDNPLKRTGAVDFFKNISTGVWSPLYNPGGALNTGLAERTQPDQISVLGWRNGDGRFLDFGPQSIGAPINKANTLSLEELSGNKYFNTVIGLPLMCSSGSCADPSLSPPFDNTVVTTTALASNILEIDEPAIIEDFPVGNSSISHMGISDFDYPVLGHTNMTVRPNSTNFNIVSAVVVDNSTTMGNPEWVIKNFPGDFTVGDIIEVYRVRWDVARGTEFTIVSGGKSNVAQSGRYTASWIPAAVEGVATDSGTAQITSGTRCAVMINQD